MRQAFSLIELSIVLVILGLLAGGILAGQSLIRAAEMRSVIADTGRYQTAFYSFRDKYFAIPGDMRNAIQFWGAAVAGAPAEGPFADCTNLTTPSTDKKTCNGDGNSRISDTTPTAWESYRAWQHLANAGLIEGSYSGITNGTANTFATPVLGVNTPRSRISNAGYTVRHYPNTPLSDPLYFPGSYGNLLLFGTIAETYTAGPALTPEEAWNLDTKLDDGLPATGKIVIPEDRNLCVTSTDPAVARYLLSSPERGCTLMIILGV